MKVVNVQKFPDVEGPRLVRYGRFGDDRGYFTETFRSSDFREHPELASVFGDLEFVQSNESLSYFGAIRGLHYQPGMGKLIRVVTGSITDVFVDLREESPSYLKATAHDLFKLHYTPSMNFGPFLENEWLWIPPGFGHGFISTSNETIVEYLCTAEYDPTTEGAVSFGSQSIDWTLLPDALFYQVGTWLASAFRGGTRKVLMSEKDRAAPEAATVALRP